MTTQVSVGSKSFTIEGRSLDLEDRDGHDAQTEVGKVLEPFINFLGDGPKETTVVPFASIVYISGVEVKIRGAGGVNIKLQEGQEVKLKGYSDGEVTIRRLGNERG